MSIKDRIDYDPETGMFTWKEVRKTKRKGNWRKAGSRHSNGYVVITYNGWHYAAARVAWYLTHGRWPTGVMDHINGIRDDNRLSNLRDVSVTENNKYAFGKRKEKHVHSRNGKRYIRSYRRAGRYNRLRDV